jgi:hypothetical protein
MDMPAVNEDLMLQAMIVSAKSALASGQPAGDAVRRCDRMVYDATIP